MAQRTVADDALGAVPSWDRGPLALEVDRVRFDGPGVRTSGDLAFLHRLLDEAGFEREVVALARRSATGVTPRYEVMSLR